MNKIRHINDSYAIVQSREVQCIPYGLGDTGGQSKSLGCPFWHSGNGILNSVFLQLKFPQYLISTLKKKI